PKSKLGGHVEPLTHASLLLAQGRSLDIVSQAETIEPFASLRDDLTRLTSGLYLAEMVDRFTEVGLAHDQDERVFVLLLGALRALDAGEHAAMVCRFLEMRLLDAFGYRPQLQGCVVCSEPLVPSAQYFGASAGGAICPSCARSEGGPVRPLSLTALKVLRLLQTKAFGEAARLHMAADVAREVEAHLRDSIHHALDRDVRSSAFLDHLRVSTAR
ncbi:MAG TPA: DNA repair protein RecO, partial [Dehalococcoidia bacterium]|nr:DNA repair protein RecO [Dehalococcoidia bacterium]